MTYSKGQKRKQTCLNIWHLKRRLGSLRNKIKSSYNVKHSLMDSTWMAPDGLDILRAMAKGSITRAKRKMDSGHPYLVPLPMLKKGETARPSLIATRGVLYINVIQHLNLGSNPISSRTLCMNWQSTQSKAFSILIDTISLGDMPALGIWKWVNNTIYQAYKEIILANRYANTLVRILKSMFNSAIGL